MDGLTNFAFTLVDYFTRWEALAHKLAEESKNLEAKALRTKVEAFADKITNFTKTQKVKK